MENFKFEKLSEDNYIIKNSDGLFIQVGEQEFRFLEFIKDKYFEDIKKFETNFFTEEEKEYLFELFKARNFLEKYPQESEKKILSKNTFEFNFTKICNFINIFEKFLFSKFFIWIFSVLFLSTFIFAILNSSILIRELFSEKNRNIFSLLTIIFTFIFPAFVHELAHIYTYFHYSGNISKMKITFLLGLPHFYCETFDAYLIKEKKKRIAIYSSSLIIHAIFFSLGFLIYQMSNNIHFLIFGVLNLIFAILNSLPFYGSDGYHIFVNLFDIINLKENTRNYFTVLFFREPCKRKFSFGQKFAMYLYFLFNFYPVYFLIILIEQVFALYVFFPKTISKIGILNIFLILIFIIIFRNIIIYFLKNKNIYRLSDYYILTKKNNEIMFHPKFLIQINSILNLFIKNNSFMARNKKEILKAEMGVFENIPINTIITSRSPEVFLKRLENGNKKIIRENRSSEGEVKVLSAEKSNFFLDLYMYRLMIGNVGNLFDDGEIQQLYTIKFIKYKI
ncbi:MAG: hypothetical protein ACRCSK_01165 [Fusobacteriaceae bacterium]